MLAKKDFSRIKELEELNEQHKKINGKLRKENKNLKKRIDEATENIKELQQENNKSADIRDRLLYFVWCNLNDFRPELRKEINDILERR